MTGDQKTKTGQMKYRMRLFVADNEPNSAAAKENIRKICDNHLGTTDCELYIIDVFEDYSQALTENILITPALVIDAPHHNVIFGNLHDIKKVIQTLGLYD